MNGFRAQALLIHLSPALETEVVNSHPRTSATDPVLNVFIDSFEKMQVAAFCNDAGRRLFTFSSLIIHHFILTVRIVGNVHV